MLNQDQEDAVDELEYGLLMIRQESVVLVDTSEGVFAVDSHVLEHHTSRDPAHLAIIGRKLKNASAFTKTPESRKCGYCEIEFYPKGSEANCPSCEAQTYWRN